MIKRMLGTLLLLMVCASSFAGNPNLSHSKYVSDVGGGFLTQMGGTRYGMTFKVSRKLARPLYVVVEFDDPADENQKLVTTLVYDSRDELIVQSDPFTSAKNGKVYRLKMQLFSDQGHVNRVASHKSKVKFNLSPDVAAIFGFELQ